MSEDKLYTGVCKLNTIILMIPFDFVVIHTQLGDSNKLGNFSGSGQLRRTA